MVPATFIAATWDVTFDLNATLSALTPAAAERGDVLLAVLCATNSLTVATMPDGWTALVSLSSGTLRLHLLRRVVTEDEPASHAFVLSGTPVASEPMLALLLYRGLDSSAAVVASGISAVAASVSFIAPSLTQAAYSDLLLLVHYADDDRTFTADAASTERVDVLSAGGPDTAAMIADHHREAVGSTGTKTATASGTASGFAAAILLAAEGLATAETVSLDPPGAIGLPSVGV